MALCLYHANLPADRNLDTGSLLERGASAGPRASQGRIRAAVHELQGLPASSLGDKPRDATVDQAEAHDVSAATLQR